MDRFCTPIIGAVLTAILIAASATAAGVEVRTAATSRPAPRIVAGTERAAGRVPRGDLMNLPASRRRLTARGRTDKARARFRDVDLTNGIEGSVEDGTGIHRLSPILMDQVRGLTDPFDLRAPNAGTSPAVAPDRTVDKDLPWSQDQVLANPTDMNDEYVSLEVDPASGYLYAVFAATDLGGTDRDIHIARSMDDGTTWEVWEMPSFVDDEYHPDLAIDGAGYLHVCWVRADGYILRSRTTTPGDPTQWAWVKGLAVGEPCATPAIAVSGAGDFAKVFIAAGWLTVNYDYLAYEWTLIFMSSSNGGNSVVYDYFLPDGYADYWPDVAMDGGIVHFVNAEVDAYSGETEILIATDAYTGGFAEPASLTGWTSDNTGFPQVACQGSDVYVVYQLDFNDGVTSDGDIIYTYSWDAATSFYGPYGMIADAYESVGPTVYVRDGTVGCLWLDAPPGGDEFHLASRLGSGFGAIETFGDVELVTTAPRVEPAFHSAAGALGADTAHAAWIDRRDFATEGHNVYRSRRDLLPNLAPYVPAEWDSSLIANMVRGERHDGWIAADDTAYVSFAFLNDGLRAVTADVTVALELDGVNVGSWILSGGLDAGTYVSLEDWPIVAGPGTHALSVVLDTDDDIVEDDEADNVLTRSFSFLAGGPEARLRPSRLVHTINPYLKRDLALAMADDPPLRREVHLPVVSPRLRAAVEGNKSEGMLRTVVVPAERLDPVALALALKGASRSARREAVITAARRQTDRALAGIRPVLDGFNKSGLAGEPRTQWLSGSIAVDLAPAAVAELAGHPDVGRIWLDERRSRAFGGPAEGSSVAGGPDKSNAWHLAAVGAEAAWAQGHTGQGVVVGHLDTGAAYDHPDLADRLWDGGAAAPHHGWDAVDDDDDPYDGDTDWHHGSHTAGLVVGNGASGTTTGVAPGASLMLLRVVPGYYSDLIEGMQFGLDNGAHLFTMSAGWTLAAPDLRAANRYNAELLLSIDVPWICASGNGDNVGGHNPVPTDISSPGDCPGPWYAPAGHPTAVFTVGGLTQGGLVTATSSYGPTSWDIDNPYSSTDYHDYPWPSGLMKPDIAAPGENIVSLAGASGYVSYDGTSMACPLVAGAFAILLGATPGMTPAQLAEACESTAVDVVASPAGPGRDAYSGAGLIAVDTALADLPATDGIPFTLTNHGHLPLVVDQVYVTANWLTVDPVPGVLEPGAGVTLTARIDPAGLAEGVHQATVLFMSNDASTPTLLPVELLYGDYVTGVDDGPPAPILGRLANHPNPFNPRTLLRFATADAGLVRLRIFDLRGRCLRTLIEGFRPAGDHEVAWDGRDDDGRELGSGTYLAMLQAGSESPASRKLTLVR